MQTKYSPPFHCQKQQLLKSSSLSLSLHKSPDAWTAYCIIYRLQAPTFRLLQWIPYLEVNIETWYRMEQPWAKWLKKKKNLSLSHCCGFFSLMRYNFSFYFPQCELGEQWITDCLCVFVPCSQLLRANSQIPRVSWQSNHRLKLFI